jgi:hypothetical protein
VGKRGIQVLELEDFMCRCGSRDFETETRDQNPTGLYCRSCGRRYSVRKRQKRTRIANLPMSFGFRSLYWDRIEATDGGIYGVSEQGYEIKEER